jgi:hypothetical protein
METHGLAGKMIAKMPKIARDCESSASGAVIFLPVFGQPVAKRRRTRLEGVLAVSGRFEVVVLFGMLSLVAQFVYWSRIVSGLNQEHARNLKA